MENGNNEVIKMLEEKKKYYLQQMKSLNLAIKGIRDAEKTKKKDDLVEDTIQWSKEIEKLFSGANSLSFENVRQGLYVAIGDKAMHSANRNAIKRTLVRKLGKTLLLTDDGRYRRM